MFHRFGDEGPSDEEIKAWVARITDIVEQGGQIDWVQIYTTARKPTDPSVLPLSVERLVDIRSTLVTALDEKSEIDHSVYITKRIVTSHAGTGMSLFSTWSV